MNRCCGKLVWGRGDYVMVSEGSPIVLSDLEIYWFINAIVYRESGFKLPSYDRLASLNIVINSELYALVEKVEVFDEYRDLLAKFSEFKVTSINANLFLQEILSCLFFKKSNVVTLSLESLYVYLTFVSFIIIKSFENGDAKLGRKLAHLAAKKCPKCNAQIVSDDVTVNNWTSNVLSICSFLVLMCTLKKMLNAIEYLFRN